MDEKKQNNTPVFIFALVIVLVVFGGIVASFFVFSTKRSESMQIEPSTSVTPSTPSQTGQGGQDASKSSYDASKPVDLKIQLPKEETTLTKDSATTYMATVSNKPVGQFTCIWEFYSKNSSGDLVVTSKEEVPMEQKQCALKEYKVSLTGVVTVKVQMVLDSKKDSTVASTVTTYLFQ